MVAALIVIALLWLGLYLLARWGYRQRAWPDWHRDILAAGLLGLACVGYFWRVIFGDAFMPADGGDLVSFLWPTYRFAAESLRVGQLPLWNPHLYSGAPHGADVQAGFLYPVNVLLFLLFPDFGVKAMEGLSILHLWWAGLGMYVFVRSLPWRVGRSGALAAGLAFAFSDPLWTHFGNLNLIAVASWLPWVMTCFVRALEAGKRWSPGWAIAGGLLLGVGTLAGHIQVTLFIGLAVALYGLFWLTWMLRGRQSQGSRSDPQTGDGSSSRSTPDQRTHRVPGPVGRLLAVTAVLALVVALVAAPILLPALGLMGDTARADWTYQDTVGFSLAPAQWIGLLMPGFFGRGPQLHWGLWPRVEVGYLGVLPLVLAALALLARRDRHTWILAGFSAAAFVLAMGIYSVPHGWLSLLPGFGLLRAPARLVLLVDFGLAALAGAGLQILLSPVSEGQNWRALSWLVSGLSWVAKVTLAVAVPLTFAALLLAQDRDPTVYLRVGVASIAVMLFVAFLLASLGLVTARKLGWAEPRTLAVLALVVLFLDLASTGAYGDLGDVDPSRGYFHPEIAAFLAQESEPLRLDARTDIDQLWQPNTALLYGLDDVWGIVNPSLLARYERYWEGMGSRSSPLYDFLNATYVVAGKDVVLDWEKFELAFEGDPDLNLYRNRTVLPRALLVHDAVVVEGVQTGELAWDAVHAPGFDPSRQVVVESSDSRALPQVSPISGEEAVDWLERGNNELVLRVTASAPGYLVLSEVWYPGWRAQVERDGVVLEQPVLRANYAFRAIPIPEAGSYQVRLRFMPTPWLLGLALGILTLVVLLLVSLWRWMRGQRNRTI